MNTNMKSLSRLSEDAAVVVMEAIAGRCDTETNQLNICVKLEIVQIVATTYRGECTQNLKLFVVGSIYQNHS